MALANFQILSPEQANPLYNALQNAMQMQKVRQQGLETHFLNPLLQQQLQQQQIKTRFAPYTAASQISANYSSPFSSALMHWIQAGKKNVDPNTAYGNINAAMQNATQMARQYDQSSQGQNNFGGQNNPGPIAQQPTPPGAPSVLPTRAEAISRPTMPGNDEANFDISKYSGAFNQIPTQTQVQIMSQLPTNAIPEKIDKGILYYYLNGKRMGVSLNG